ncbi:site-specific integrase [Paenibacillus maysiensis]|uniref:site-specific integrase n=1 Tax=Paenibacillus maysiensis TaxID=1155954 RepID=UPI0004717FD7|nr:site-specific integrase [Paenibacillus maysiensis]
MAEPFVNEKTKKWDFVFDYYDETGKRRQIRRKGFKTKREANDKMVGLQNDVKNKEYIRKDNTTLNEFMDYWLDNIRVHECGETTLYNNKLYFKNHIKPKFGKIKLQYFDLLKCQDFVNELHKKNFARNTIDRITTMVKKVFDKAIEYGFIKENPMRKVTLPKRIKKELSIWTLEQVNHFLQFTKEDRYHCVYGLALLAGMRQGEILGLRWKDIDFESKTITIRQTLAHYGTRIKSGAKTNAGERKISIPNQLIAILKEQRRLHEAYKVKWKREFGDGFVDMDIVIFNLKNGKTVFPANLSKVYKRDVLSAKLPHIRFHDMRHTHATMLLEKKMNVKVISERLGHSKISVTLDTYSHVLPSMQQEVADELEQMIML